MTERSETIFTCDGCEAEVLIERHVSAPHEWRVLTWQGAYVGSESREAHFCGQCRESRLRALDVLLMGRGRAGRVS